MISDNLALANNDCAMNEETNQETDISAIKSAEPTPLVRPNKKLSESRLRLAAITSLATQVETEIVLKEAIRGTRRTFAVADQIPCNDCISLKPVNRLQCQNCKGLGYQKAERQVEVAIQGGIMDGQEIRYANMGAADIRSGKNGDLLVKIKITEHPYLKIEGKNITCTLPVSLYEAVLGAEIEVPTATGKVVMKIQPLTQPGRVYRLKGLGLAGGDQLVTIEVTMPQVLTKEQVELFKKIKEKAGDGNPRGALVLSH